MNRYAATFICTLLFAAFLNKGFAFPYNESKTLAIGATAPDFNLPGVDGKSYSLSNFKEAGVLVIVFTCNHCPTAQAYENRIIELSGAYSKKGVKVIAVSPNDPNAIRLDELGYSDLSDSFEEMKLRARQKKFNFPYLYDGKTQSMSKAYGPVATPHVFIFDRQRKLRYNGRFDDMEKPTKTPSSYDTRNAIEALLAGNEPPVQTTKVFGCSVKWAEKQDWLTKAKADWSKEPVTLETINEAGLKDLIKNSSGKLRLINVWATWCGPCVRELPDFMTINRMYRGRDFEFITVSADDPAHKDKASKHLQKLQASGANYIFDSDDKYKLIEAVDPRWQGALPYTILVEPGGKIVYAKQGGINPYEIKKLIVDNPVIGRYY